MSTETHDTPRTVVVVPIDQGAGYIDTTEHLHNEQQIRAVYLRDGGERVVVSIGASTISLPPSTWAALFSAVHQVSPVATHLDGYTACEGADAGQVTA